MFSSMKVSSRLEKNPQSGFFNNHLGVEDVDRVLVESRVIRIGRWSLSYISCKTDQEILWASDELEIDRSIAEKVPFEGLSLVGWPLLRSAIESLSRIFSIDLPRVSVFSDPQWTLWLLKSPNRIKGLGSCVMMLSRSDVLKGVWFGMYMLHILILNSSVNWTAITSRSDWIGICSLG